MQSFIEVTLIAYTGAMTYLAAHVADVNRALGNPHGYWFALLIAAIGAAALIAEGLRTVGFI